MKLGLHISNFTWPDGAPALSATFADIATSADEAGFDRVSVMDHVWQIAPNGAPEQPMLEAYTALGFLAGITKNVKLMTMVTGVTYRSPGLLAKAVSTLDVLSKGRAILGIGAAWNEDESKGLGLFFPPLKERFERLEETLRICKQMFAGDETPFRGEHYQLDRLLNDPLPLSRPGPPILIGGGGEKKTLRLVAQYADSCNLFAREDLGHKLDVIKQHCEDVGRDYDTIEKTVQNNFDLTNDSLAQIVEQARKFKDLGFTVWHGGLRNAYDTKQFEVFKNEIVPALEAL